MDVVRIKLGNFAHLTTYWKEEVLPGVAGVLFDLGMSTDQLKYSDRGFSFHSDAPLDMRMSEQMEHSAADLLRIYTAEELEELFVSYGEERFARQIAEAIIETRRQKPVETTQQLATLAATVYKTEHIREKIDPATRVFQALRIAVNDELANLKKALPQTIELLDSGGRCVVISFHSLEDRIVKQLFQAYARNNTLRIITKKPITATEAEVSENPASRSAKLRVAEKI